MAQLTVFGKEVKKRLVDMDQRQVWLIDQVREKTGLYFDDSYNKTKGRKTMVKITVTGDTPLEALSHLTAFGMRCMMNEDVCRAANRILEEERYKEAKAAAAQAQKEATPPPQEVPVQEPISDTPQAAPAPTAATGPADGANGLTAAPGGKPEPAPTAEQVRAKGIDASRKYGKEAVVATLKKYGVSGMSAIAEKDRAAFLADLEGLGVGNA